MKRACFGILLLIVLIVGCATATINTIDDFELVIKRLDTSYYGLKLTIDGKNYGKIGKGETKTFKIPNGLHIINGIKSNGFNDSISFESDNERIEITVDVSSGTKFEIRNRVTLSQPQNLTPLQESAISASFKTLNPLIPNSSKIAIVNITPADANISFIQEELMILFVNSQKFTVVDRQTLDSIREEQRFQMTGEVSDETAVSVGQFLGADVVIVGSVSGNVPQRRLRLRAINVKTAQILAMSSEEI